MGQKAFLKLFLFSVFLGSHIFHLAYAQNMNPEVVVQMGHRDGFQSFVFTDDGKYILTGGSDIKIKLWEVSSGKEIKTYEGHSAPIVSLAFSRDGQYFYSGSWDKTIRKWETFSGKELKTIQESIFQTILLSGDGKYLLIGGYENTLKFMDTERDSVVKILSGHSGLISAAAMTPDNNLIITGSYDNNIKLWDFNSGAEKMTYSGHSDHVTSVSISSDGKYILSGSDDKTVRLWDSRTGQTIKTFAGHDDRITSVSLSNDMKKAVSSSYDKSVKVWDIESGKELTSLTLDYFVFGKYYLMPIRTMSLSRDGKYIIAGDMRTLKMWDINTFHEVKTIRGYATEWGLGVSRDDKFLFTNGEFGLSRWDIALGKKNKAFFVNSNLLKLSADDSLVLSSCIDSTLRTIKVTDSEILNKLKSNENVYAIAISNNSKYAYTGNFDNTITKWDLATGNKLKSFGQKGENFHYVTTIAVSPDDKYLIAASSDKSMCLWDAETGKLETALAGHNDFVRSICFSPDGTLAISGGWDKKVKVWEIPSGNLKREFTGHIGFVESVSISPDGRFVISGGNDKLIKIWDLSAGKEIKTFKGSNDNVLWVAFSHDGKRIFSSGAERSTKMWDFASGNEICTFISLYGNDYITVTPDNYYTCSNNGFKGVSFVMNEHAFPFEQFDLQYNRPDIVLERIGYAPKELIETYRRAYLKRLKKMKFDEGMFNKDFHMPEIKIQNERLPLNTTDKYLAFKIKAEDTKYNLDRVNIYVNDVPVYGNDGIRLTDREINKYEDSIKLELSYGKNKVQVSVLNEKGVESLKETFEIVCDAIEVKHDLYVVAIGVSDYDDSRYKLKYASKDANDIVDVFLDRKNRYNEIKVKKITDKDVTKENILKIKDFLMMSKVDDEVIVLIAGHGLITIEFDYYFAAADIDFSEPQKRGVTFEEIENLLDGIPARHKILFMDTCHSGEIDKEDLQITAVNEKQVEEGDVVFRDVPGIKISRKNESEGFGVKNVSDVMQEMFVDLRRGSGAMIISSSGGLEVSFEGGGIKNGLFTHCIIEGLKTGIADLNKDGKITVSELRDFVVERVEKLTHGAQKPTARRDNFEFDFVVW